MEEFTDYVSRLKKLGNFHDSSTEMDEPFLVTLLEMNFSG